MATRTYPPFDDSASPFVLWRPSSYEAWAPTGGAETLVLASPTDDNNLFDRWSNPNVVIMDDVAAVNFDATVEWTWADTGEQASNTSRGFGITGRLTGTSGPGYSVSASASTGNVTLRAVGANSFWSEDFDANLIGSATKAFGGFAAGTAYRLRVQVVESDPAGTSTVRARVWAAASAEPGTWDLEATLVQGAGSIAQQARYTSAAGPVGFFNGGDSEIGGGLSRGRSYAVSSFVVTSSEISEYPPPAPPSPLPEAAPVGELDSPVTVRFREEVSGVFADPTIEASFFELVNLPLGSLYTLGDQLSGEPWYTFAIRDRTKSGGIVSYVGETLLARLGRANPRESLVLVAGQNGVPDPLDLRECLRRFLVYYGVPFDPDLPAFYLRAGDTVVAPTVEAFVIQPDQENPDSIFEHLEAFFGPFRGYTWRANEDDELVVTPPSWLDSLGLPFILYRRRLPRAYLTRDSILLPWAYPDRAPGVAYVATVNGAPYSGTMASPALGSFSEVTLGPITFRATWAADGEELELEALGLPAGPSDSFLYTATFTATPSGAADPASLLALSDDDLAPDNIETTSSDSVINQATLGVRARTFTPGQQVMQAAAAVLRSPTQLAAGLFGNNPEYGPMAWAPDTPAGFLELVNANAQEGTFFWPVDPGVVAEPGAGITVEWDVEEWVEKMDDLLVADGPAELANSYTGSASLPANGTEVKLWDFVFPRQSSNFVVGAYGAKGSVWGRWRQDAESPGIELRFGDSRYVEWGYDAVFLIFGSTRYYLWGVQVKLNGLGTTFTTGDLQTYRFGFTRADDGSWEGGALVPGLATSQALYPARAYTAPELPYAVDAATALALVRGIVEENLTPKTVYQLPIRAAREDGYAFTPRNVGRAGSALGRTGRFVTLDYTEAHSASGTTSALVAELEVAQPPEGSPAAATGFALAIYGSSKYGAATASAAEGDDGLY